VDRLQEAVREGWIDVIGTDHSPFLAGEKGTRDGDIWAAPPGFRRWKSFCGSC
jgi:dihydroorotase-like cyclic amidohydrolase